MTTRPQPAFALLPASWMALIWQMSADSVSGIKSFRLARGIWASLLTPVTRLEPTYPMLFMTDAIARKGAHVAEYAILAGLMLLALRRGFPTKPAAWVARHGFLLTLLWAGIDEWHQTFVPGRMGQVGDVAIDGIGACLMTLVWLWCQRRATSRRGHRASQA